MLTGSESPVHAHANAAWSSLFPYAAFTAAKFPPPAPGSREEEITAQSFPWYCFGVS